MFEWSLLFIFFIILYLAILFPPSKVLFPSNKRKNEKLKMQIVLKEKSAVTETNFHLEGVPYNISEKGKTAIKQNDGIYIVNNDDILWVKYTEEAINSLK